MKRRVFLAFAPLLCTVALAASGWVGISVNVETSGSFFSPKIEKVTVNGLNPNGPAAKAGVQVGDQVVAINDTVLKGMSAGDAKDLLKPNTGDKVKFKVRRGESQLDIPVVAGTRPD
jgi:C-terminal processing protease CtpA/Prc